MYILHKLYIIGLEHYGVELVKPIREDKANEMGSYSGQSLILHL